jgi:hypothetical protein
MCIIYSIYIYLDIYNTYTYVIYIYTYKNEGCFRFATPEGIFVRHGADPSYGRRTLQKGALVGGGTIL